MLKQETVKLEDSNLANYGSQMHKDAKEKKAQAEKEYKGAGATVGIEVWRIENFGVKKITDTKLHGKFFSGDSYIVLNTYKKENTLAYNAHFWLGSESSQDERGTAAFKVVELDDLLGDLPVQYRECEGFESKKFLKCFGGAITTMAGGIASAFNVVKPTEYTTRLMIFKGTGKKLMMKEVPCALASLNNGDVFLLDNGLELIQWNGPQSNGKERRKAMEMIVQIKEDRNGRPKSRVMDGQDADDVFWTKLGVSGPSPVAEAIDDSKDGRASIAETQFTPQIMRVSDASGSLETTVVASGVGEIKRSVLDSNDCFIVDVGQIIYVWVGNGATAKERAMSMRNAVTYLEGTGRPVHTPISRQLEGNESEEFLGSFIA